VATILIVEDEPMNRDLLKNYVVSCGYEVVTAVDGAEAIAVFQRQRFHLVFLDLGLPKISGVDVLKKMKGSSPDTPVVIITGRPDDVLSLHSRDLWPEMVIVKPFMLSQIKEALRLVKNGEQQAAASISLLEGQLPVPHIPVKEEVRIRKMTEADLEGIQKIDKRLVGKDRSSTWLESAEAVWFTQRPSLNFVAETGGQVVGFLLGDIRGAEYGLPFGGWITMIGLLPEFQHRGIAKNLVEEFCEKCKENKVRARVIIREDDELLLKFCNYVGFKKGKLVSFER